jgi:hypothetical protein
LELLPGFGPGTSSLPIDSTAFRVVPVQQPENRLKPCISMVQAVSLCRFVHRKTIGFQPETADLLENLLEKPEGKESWPLPVFMLNTMEEWDKWLRRCYFS